MQLIICCIIISSLILPSMAKLVIQMQVDRDQGNDGRNFSFASYFGNHMVLQGEPQMAVIWGYAPEGSEGLTVTLAIEKLKVEYKTVVGPSLTWQQSIGPVTSGGPYTITATLETRNQTVNISDVLFGDVWVCSGQSNMQFSMEQVINASAELKDALHYPHIRLFVVKDNTSDTPLTDLSPEGIQLPWTQPTPETLAGGAFKYFSAVCWLYGKYLYQTIRKPIGLVETCWGGTPVEAWSSPEALSKCGLTQNKQQLLPSNQRSSPSNQQQREPGLSEITFGGPQEYSVLWNAMISPLLSMSIFGAIWYQGENNAKLNKDLYACTFPAMIDDWRKQFNSHGGTSKLFPFGFVQLAAFNPDYSEDTGFPDIRWHQTANYGYVPNHRQRNVFMAVAMDLPDFLSPYGPIHSRYKQPVAARLVMAALAVAYGFKVPYQGPFPVILNASEPHPGTFPLITIQYSVNVVQKWLDGFEICCAFSSPPSCQPGKSWWLPTATAQDLYQANTTTSYAMQCPLENIVGIRYAWRDSPCPFNQCAIYGADSGLPLPPFTFTGEKFMRNFVNKNSFVVKLLQ